MSAALLSLEISSQLETDWLDFYNNHPHSNLLQSPNTAIALCPTLGQKPLWGKIFLKTNSKLIGIFQLTEAGILGNLVHALILDRGPLWDQDYLSQAMVLAFFKNFADLYPARWGRKRRCMPEYADTPAFYTQMAELGYRRNDRFAAYKTVWLHCEAQEENQMAAFKKNWRHALKKGLEHHISVEWHNPEQYIKSVALHYKADRMMKDYQGTDTKTLEKLMFQYAKTGDLWIGRVNDQTGLSAFMVFLKHGKCLTYQAGWSGISGRSCNAHHLILWDVLQKMRDQNMRAIDLGGINDAIKGIAQFKSGTGGQITTLGSLYM